MAEGPVPHPSSFGRRRRRWVLVSGVAAAVAVLTWLFAFGLSRDPSVIASPLIGRPAPAFDLVTLDGSGRVRLAELRGQVVVVNFWASWCTECRVEHPALAAAWQRYSDRGVVFVGIPFQDRPSASRAYLARYVAGWPILEDPGSTVALAFGVYGVPETFVIGPDGRVRYKRIGAVDFGQLSDQISRLLPGAER